MPLDSDPPNVQLTFVPGEHGFAWWGDSDIPARLAEAGLPSGREATIRLAQPEGDHVNAADVAVTITDLVASTRALAVLGNSAEADSPTPSPRWFSASARVWSDLSAVLVTSPSREEDGTTADLTGTSDDPVSAAPTDPTADPTAAVETAVRRLPPAGHAVLNEAETAMMTPQALINRFRSALRTEDSLSAVDAVLRPYQSHGITWLREQARDSSGAILADEMGLGKTIQAIGLLATSTADRPHLVVAPTSVVGNWKREVQRFAPQIPVIVYHGASRVLPENMEPGTVVLTSYPLLRAEEMLKDTDWAIAVFDEAQQVKNPRSQVARAARELHARTKIAMTGTPVENNLDELWSIFSVVNPHVLGTRRRFRERFIVPITQRRSARAATTLSTLIGPHLLRRTKDVVADELPPRIDTSVICSLSSEQARLYRREVDQAFATGFGTGFGRNGRVLALVTALKQICNHPAQFLGKEFSGPERSGKFDRACEILAEVVDGGQRALVFTQYRAMGEILAAGIATATGCDAVPFLHGGLSAGQRDDMVRRFQEDDDAPPVLILSLRAAGFGLNLTRASHVVHFDRWWNPAVEEQATSRAHRIGQRDTLEVHTLITEGTIEDHIDRMHTRKQGMANLVTGDPVAALASLPDEELRSLFTLDAKEFD